MRFGSLSFPNFSLPTFSRNRKEDQLLILGGPDPNITTSILGLRLCQYANGTCPDRLELRVYADPHPPVPSRLISSLISLAPLG